jgi:hypothetical protein
LVVVVVVVVVVIAVVAIIVVGLEALQWLWLFNSVRDRKQDFMRYTKAKNSVSCYSHIFVYSLMP